MQFPTMTGPNVFIRFIYFIRGCYKLAVMELPTTLCTVILISYYSATSTNIVCVCFSHNIALAWMMALALNLTISLVQRTPSHTE